MNIENKYDVIIIGSGLGGLECGYILSKKGFNVCILEKNAQIGGCLQTFRRGDAVFDTGFHYVGGLEEGQSLNTLFRYFDLMELPWHKLDENGFAEIVMNDRSYFFASGYECFAEILTKDFPHQRMQIIKYTDFLKQTGSNIWKSFDIKNNGNYGARLFEKSAYSFMQSAIDDKLLRDVLSGSSLIMDLCAEKLPLYVFAQINSSFIQSSWRLNGEGSLIANKLSDSIRKMGGTIITKANVTGLTLNNGYVGSVVYNETEKVEGKYVISDIHPSATLSLIPETPYVRKIYRKRISGLENTTGMFTVHLKLKPDTVPYLNRNIFIYKDQDLWNTCHYDKDSGTRSLIVSYRVPANGSKYTENIDILTPMHWKEVEKWQDTYIGQRGEDYKLFKLNKARECIDILTQRIPEIKGNIEKYYTSSPLTYRDYTGTCEGSAYGIRKDFNNVMQTMLSPQTQIPNLLLTGQNLNLHGILGVSMTSFFTCAKIAGMESIINDLNINNNK